jgi:hypothetical protein
MHHRSVRFGAVCAAVFVIATTALAQPAQRQWTELVYNAPFVPGAVYDPAVPTPDALLGFQAGSRPATHAEIERCFKAWDASDRAMVIQYATTHEGRASYIIVISDPANLARLDEIKTNRARIADPRGVSRAERERIASEEPTVAWLGYSIHGDETSGADAALNFAYHLVADTTDATKDLLENVVVVLDPMMNPDGRDRYLKMQRELDGEVPSVDTQALIHNGYWPAGRTNHYNFDLNRDWIFGVHPETRGRIRASREFNPLLFVDAHEMGALDTYLFSPSRSPKNIHVPARREHWNNIFAQDQANAFDDYGWRYYTGEWNEGWYPGYSDAWAGFRGAIPILYEQAGVAPYGVKRHEGTVLTYREAVHHQLTSSLANVRSLAANKDAVTADWLTEREAAVSDENPWAGRVFAIKPDGNDARLRAFTDLMSLEGIEVRVADDAFTSPAANRLGESEEEVEFPAGTLLIFNRQPEAHLLATLLDFDPRIPTEFLEKERREILRFGSSLLYDITAWNISMLQDVDAYVIDAADAPETSAYTPAPAEGGADRLTADVGWVIPGGDDAAVVAAAQLMERGVEVRVADRPFTWDGAEFPRGSLFISVADNRLFKGDLAQTISDIAADARVRAFASDTGFGAGDENPDAGGGHYPLLERPRIAIVSRDGVSPNSFGELWYVLDFKLGVPTSQIQANSLGFTDLREYNVIILPSTFGPAVGGAMDALREWVSAGGTLIAVGSSASALASESANMSSVRRLRDALGELDAYEQQVLREYAGRNEVIDDAVVWSYDAPADETFVWTDAPSRPGADELKRRDEWNRLFDPQGAVVAARTDDKHWLTFGAREYLSALVSGSTVLMADDSVEAPVRVGVYRPATQSSEGEAGDTAARAGWSLLPEGQTLRVRMSGLLWPEASSRLANSALVTRERKGDGQIILFNLAPAFRGATLGAERIFTNAVIYGPGLGANHPINP